MQSKFPSINIVIPVYNEQESLVNFHQKLRTVIDDLPNSVLVTYINDGSDDHSAAILSELQRQDDRVEVLELSRNFGHQAALTAGIDRTRADILITMDGDGQHPPKMIPEMLQKLSEGYDLVLTQRQEKEKLSTFKSRSSQLFYRLINHIGNTDITPGGADFRAMHCVVVEALRSMPEYHRFLRGMVAWTGFRKMVLPFNEESRIAGKSKYTFQKMFKLSMDAIFSFSLVPLYISISLGVLLLFLSVVEAVYVLSFWVTGHTSFLAPGWSSLMFVLLFIGGSLMIVLGIVGVYIGYIFQQVKQRPVYVLRNISLASQQRMSLKGLKSFYE